MKLREAEDKLLAEIEEAVTRGEKELVETNLRRSRHRRNPPQVGVATANQIASALNERLKPTAEQAVKANELAQRKKEATRAQQQAQVCTEHFVVQWFVRPLLFHHVPFALLRML